MSSDENILPRLAKVYDEIRSARNYIVHRKPDDKPQWFFQIFTGELQRRAYRGDFNVVAICNHQSSEEVIFSIPYSYLKEKILPRAHIEVNRRYLFNINKSTYEFNWNRNIKMDGNKFLISSNH